MNQLIKQEFSFANQKLELYSFFDEQGTLWMQANPFAQTLGYSNNRDALMKHVADINKTVYNGPRDSYTPSNWQPQTKFINEPGLYQLIMRSKMPNAVDFQMWVCNEVLPALKNPIHQFRAWLNKHPELCDHPAPEGFIYVATTRKLKLDGIYKIGMTSCLDSRLIQLNTASYDDYFFVYTFASPHYQELEKKLHSEFNDYREKREFFKLNVDDLDDISRFCIKFEKNKK